MAVLLKHREMKESRLNIHIVLEEKNFLWDEQNVFWFRKLWNEGRSFRDICQKLRRPKEEVFLLALEQMGSRNVKQRPEVLRAGLRSFM